MMSSWFSVSLPNPFKQSDDHSPSPPLDCPTTASDDHSPSVSGAGMREDLSAIGQTIGRQLRGVAGFLAPPPSAFTAEEIDSSSKTLLGIKNDLLEIGGSFKSSLSLLSPNKAVSEISRFALSLLQFEDDEEEGSKVPGITEEVLEFVREISMRPECWTDFPLSLDSDFDMSHAQREHVSTIECLIPSFAELRHKMCSYLNEEKFWMIYFVMLLPRLPEHDAKLLSTPKVVEAREILLLKLKNKRNSSIETSGDSQILNKSQESGKGINTMEEGAPSQRKGILAETVSAEESLGNDLENNERGLDAEEDGAKVFSSLDVQKQPEIDDGVSFSDLEDEDNNLKGQLSTLRLREDDGMPSTSGSNDWVCLDDNAENVDSGQKAGESSSGEKYLEDEDSNDWLTIDEVDLAV